MVRKPRLCQMCLFRGIVGPVLGGEDKSEQGLMAATVLLLGYFPQSLNIWEAGTEGGL